MDTDRHFIPNEWLRNPWNCSAEWFTLPVCLRLLLVLLQNMKYLPSSQRSWLTWWDPRIIYNYCLILWRYSCDYVNMWVIEIGRWVDNSDTRHISHYIITRRCVCTPKNDNNDNNENFYKRVISRYITIRTVCTPKNALSYFQSIFFLAVDMSRQSLRIAGSILRVILSLTHWATS